MPSDTTLTLDRRTSGDADSAKPAGSANSASSVTSDQPADASAQQRAYAIARKYAALPEDRRRLFREKAQQQGIDPARLPVVPLVSSHASRYPLSHAQERLWFLWKLDPQNPAYNLARAVRLTGALDAPALRRAMAALVARHGALRARFVEEQGVASQWIDATAGYSWREIALDDPDALRDTLRELAREPFDLSAGPLLRASLVALGGERHALLIATHHIVSDGWSQGLLVRELVALYRAARQGEAADIAAALPPLSIHYGDVAAWQREWLDNTIESDLAYWTQQLGGDRPVLELPLDRPRNAVRGIDGGRCRIDVDASLTGRLRERARGRRTTLFTLLLGAYAVLLHRYGGQRHVRIGVPSAGRDRSETEGLIGYFVNTLVIEAEVDGALPFDALLDTLHTRVLEAQAHQTVPFGRILDELKIARDLGRSPLFQVMFNLEQAGGNEAAATMPGVTVEAEEGGTDTARFDLVLNVVDDRSGLKLMFNYATDVFDRSTIERLSVHYVEVLEQLAAGEGGRVGALTLGSVGEGQPAQQYAFASLGEQLSAQAARSPDAVAVRCEDASLSYAQLDAWSGAIAARLVARGVRAETRVGLCVTRGPAMLAALLGVIRSGGAFVPLDPEYPAARLAQMIEDAGIVQVLADDASAERVADVLAGCEVVPVAFDGAVGTVPAVTLHPDQLAYVLYTSGSTGKPKGVAVSHGSLWTHLQDFLQTYRITSADTVLHSSTINFDVALHETLPALLTGATVEMRGVQPWDLQGLSDRLVQRQVTFARIPTALWQQWQRSAPARESLALRQVTVGGEALPGDALGRWQSGPLGGIRLDNLYGPTETTVAALYRETVAEDVQQVTVPIGKPYPGRTARVIDAFGDAAPAGGLGELCIGGPTVARGYLGRAAQTAERFVPDPYGEPGSRQYRSGDLCRMRADGTVEFLGRLDQQVKLRGQRIELGEIEAVMRQCAGVREAAVIVVGAGERQRLAGYIAGDIDTDVVQRELEQKLPAYMVPSTLTVLEKLPAMPNGKLDRAALPAPQAREREQVGARNTTEANLLSIWSAVLGRDDLGVTDNFFEVGGDSIQSLQIIARAREAGLKLTPRQVFEHPTVERLALRAEAVEAGAQDDAEITTELPLTPIQQWFFERYPQGESHWNQSVLLKVEGQLDPQALEQAVSALGARHDALRLRFVQTEAGWRQRVIPAAAAAEDTLIHRETLTTLEELDAAGQRVQSSLNLTEGPLWRVGYFETTQQETRLLVAIHHLAVDGVSWRVLLEELQTAYAQAERRETVTLPAPSTSWSAWVRRVHDYAGQADRVAELAWWQATLDTPSLRSGPVFAPLTPTATPQKTLSWKLSPERTATLLREAPRAYRMRVDEVLLAVLASVVGSETGRSELLVELEGHGREDVIDGVDLSRTVGWFTTQYPVALPCHGEPGEALHRVRERLASVPRRGLNWGLLLNGADAASHAALAALPVPEISFNYLGRFDQTFQSASRFDFAGESSGEAVAASALPPDRALDVNGWIAGDSLELTWGYAPQHVSDTLAAKLVAAFDAALAATLDHLCAAAANADEPATRPAIPLSIDPRGVNDGVMTSWIERASLEASFAPPAPEALAQWLRSTASSRTALRPVVPLNALGAPHTLFCPHPGHGMIGEYRTLAHALNGRATLHAIQAPGLRDAPWHGNTFEALAAHYVASVEAVQPVGPLALLGWSFGGRLAIAMAALLAQRGRDVSFVGIVDTATHWERDAESDTSPDDDPATTDARTALDATSSLLGAAFAADALHTQLLEQHVLPHVATDLHVWRALRNTADPRRRMDWAQQTTGRTVDHPVDATHTSIVHHPALLDALVARFS
ncbi:amino acid adenylation domain-containing protein [Paraburkholderia megapolitana]|uniref:amino acid adenylation domain-containing protein n=1 Tax=Paraburkholderia megapolitana TaxID=420953 RepID=UPI003FD73D0D